MIRSCYSVVTDQSSREWCRMMPCRQVFTVQWCSSFSDKINSKSGRWSKIILMIVKVNSIFFLQYAAQPQILYCKTINIRRIKIWRFKRLIYWCSLILGITQLTAVKIISILIWATLKRKNLLPIKFVLQLNKFHKDNKSLLFKS